MTSRKHRTIFIWTAIFEKRRNQRPSFKTEFVFFCFPYRTIGCVNVNDTCGVMHYAFTFESKASADEPLGSSYYASKGILKPNAANGWNFLRNRQPLNFRANQVINFLEENSPGEFSSLIRVKSFPSDSDNYRKTLFQLGDGVL